MNYFISFDLTAGGDYKGLMQELQRYGAVQVLKWQWCIRQEGGSVNKVINHFRNFIHSGDGISVAEIRDWAL